MHVRDENRTKLCVRTIQVENYFMHLGKGESFRVFLHVAGLMRVNIILYFLCWNPTIEHTLEPANTTGPDDFAFQNRTHTRSALIL
uniref:Uncharacterized protein n=1 Tax=Arundo donax TaxID=35708 RepID=A0A0A8XNL8_ARUDO